MSTIVDGKLIAAELESGLRKRVSGHSLGLAAVLVGDKPGIAQFVALKKKAAERIGIQFKSVSFPAAVLQETVIVAVRELNADDSVQGVFVELPLPPNCSRDAVLNAIDPAKDVDMLSAQAQERFFQKQSKILPPAVRALEIVLQKHGINVRGRTAVVFGQGFLVGKPIAHWLRMKGALVDVVDENTPEPGTHTRGADLIVSGAGKPGLICGDMVKDDAVVVDYGYSYNGEKAVGDVDFHAVALKASLVTPVPGGMGPIVIAAVLENLVSLAGL